VELFLDTAVDLGASDVHFNPTENVTLITYRIDGVLQPQYSLPAVMHNRLISTIKISAGMDIAEQNRPQDGRMTVKYLGEDFDLRISTVPTAYGENMVIRVLSGGVSILSLSDLGFGDDQVAITGRLGREPHGMILATGPTGSGKSTTLYALLRSINCIDRNVMTVEDPIEFDMPMAHQVAVNEKAGITFASAIRTFFRQDPDVILVGEIRDEETATLGIRAALTGHLVLSSLHANDAAGAITRLNDLGVGFFLLSTSLSGIIAQRLVRRLCPYCKRPAATTDEERRRFKLENTQILKAVGCAHCRRTGYLGRLAIGEVLEVDEEMRELIAQGKSSIEINRAAVRKGMRTLKQSALQLVAAGATDLAEVDRVVK
jgi:type IV pilus assembly protein PilB